MCAHYGRFLVACRLVAFFLTSFFSCRFRVPSVSSWSRLVSIIVSQHITCGSYNDNITFRVVWGERFASIKTCIISFYFSSEVFFPSRDIDACPAIMEFSLASSECDKNKKVNHTLGESAACKPVPAEGVEISKCDNSALYM